MNIVSFGGGTNSTAMIIGMYERKIPIDLILFADPGAEHDHTYEHIEIMQKWLVEHGMPKITIVENVDCEGNRFTLEQECLRSGTLPSIAYGFKKCSLKHKVGPQDKFCNNYQPCIDVWHKGEKVFKYIGYDAGEERRKTNAFAIDLQDKKYKKAYALIDWCLYREDCVKKIQEYGLPLPGKSSCFFCPSMKKKEIKSLYKNNPDKYKRAIEIERNAKPNLITVKGLGRDYAWEDYINEQFVDGKEVQIGMCAMYEDNDIPCGCYDG
jgi:hypothetical protein